MNSAHTSTPSRSSGGGGDGDGGSATSTSSSRGSTSSRISTSSTRSSGFSSRPSKGGQTSTKPSGTMASSRDEPSSSSAASRRKVRKTSSQFFQQRYHWTCDALYGIDDAFEHHGADGASLCGFCGFKFYWTDDECFARQGRHLVKRHGFGRCGSDVGFASKTDFTRHLVTTHKMVVRDFHQGSPVDFADDSWLDRFFRRWGEAPLLPRTAAAAVASPVRRNMTAAQDDDGEDDNSNSNDNNNKNNNNVDVADVDNNHHHNNNNGGGGGSTSNSSSTEPQPDTADALTTLRELAAVLQEAGLAPSLRLRAPRGELTGHPWLQPAYVSALCMSLAKLDDEETVAALGEERFADACYVSACLAEDLAVAGHEDLLALEGYLSPAHDVVNRVVVGGEALDRYRAAHRLNTGWEMLVDDGHEHEHGHGGSGDAAPPRRFRTLLDAVRHRCRAAGAEQALSQTNPKSIVRILESARASVMRSSNGYLMRQRRLGRALTTDNLRRLPGLDSRSDGCLSQRIDDWLLGIFVHSIPLRRILMSGMVVPELATTDPCSWAAFLLEHWDGEPVGTHCVNQPGGGYTSLLDSPSSGYFSFGATIGES